MPFFLKNNSSNESLFGSIHKGAHVRIENSSAKLPYNKLSLYLILL
jgi:hypothetical protein